MWSIAQRDDPTDGKPERWSIHGGIDGITRKFWLQPPLSINITDSVVNPSFPQQSRPVLMVFHGFGGLSFNSFTRWSKIAFRLDVWLFVPDGSLQKGWNAIDCCGAALSQNIHEIDFFDGALQLLKERYGTTIDSSNVIATGFSNGGFLTSLMGQHHPDWLKAIVPAAGYQYRNYDNDLQPIPIFMHHAQNDTVVSPNGCCSNPSFIITRPLQYEDSNCPISIGAEVENCMSVQDAFTIWLQTNSCKFSSSTSHLLHPVLSIQETEETICQIGIDCVVPTQFCVWKNMNHNGKYVNLIQDKSYDFLSTSIQSMDLRNEQNECGFSTINGAVSSSNNNIQQSSSATLRNMGGKLFRIFLLPMFFVAMIYAFHRSWHSTRTATRFNKSTKKKKEELVELTPMLSSTRY